MKNGFSYSYTCNQRMLEGMKKASETYWTEKIEVSEVSEEEHLAYWNAPMKEEPTEKKSVKAKTQKVEKKPQKKEKVIPQFSGLENFFESSEPAPKNKKLKKRV